ncbi:MAG: ArsR family transcriptional regulator [Nitrososphaerota archaeon]|nr:ArsR family transcriptional regulator [Nitrososphaerota archaeon]
MSQLTLRKELEKKYSNYALAIESSEPYWDIFTQVVKGHNYVTSISRELKKNKSIISRQLRRLEDVAIITSTGSGVKQTYQIDWDVLTTYWIWTREITPDVISDLKEVSLLPKKTPDLLGKIYISENEEKNWKALDKVELHEILEPIVPQLSQIIKLLVESMDNWHRTKTFFDAFQAISLSFGVGLSVLDLDPKEIDIPATRQLFETLYDKRVRTWLNYESVIGLAGANIVKNHMLRLAGLIKG